LVEMIDARKGAFEERSDATGGDGFHRLAVLGFYAPAKALDHIDEIIKLIVGAELLA